jgi:hypothetical protein
MTTWVDVEPPARLVWQTRPVERALPVGGSHDGDNARVYARDPQPNADLRSHVAAAYR